MRNTAIILCLETRVGNVANEGKQFSTLVAYPVLPTILLRGIIETANTVLQTATLTHGKSLLRAEFRLKLPPEQNQRVSHVTRVLPTSCLQGHLLIPCSHQWGNNLRRNGLGQKLVHGPVPCIGSGEVRRYRFNIHGGEELDRENTFSVEREAVAHKGEKI
jgi:hypothetical protein